MTKEATIMNTAGRHVTTGKVVIKDVTTKDVIIKYASAEESTSEDGMTEGGTALCHYQGP
jgi:hypothetical protein